MEEGNRPTDRACKEADRYASGLRVCLAFTGFWSAGSASGAGFADGRRAFWGRRLAAFLGDLGRVWIPVLMVMAIFTFVLLALATLLPRKLAQRDPEKSIRRLSRMALAANSVFLPLARLCNAVYRALVRYWRGSILMKTAIS